MHQFSNLSTGQHTLSVTVYDLAGNGATSTVTFYVDNVQPTLSITSPADNFYSDRSSVKVVWIGDDANSGLKGLQLPPGRRCLVPLSGDISHSFDSLAEGPHVIDVMAMDNANNSIVRTVHVMVDTIAPTLVIDGPAKDVTTSSSVTVSWTGNDEMSGVSGYVYRLDGRDWTEMSGNVSTSSAR